MTSYFYRRHVDRSVVETSYKIASKRKPALSTKM